MAHINMQVEHESQVESFDARRVNMLKAQIAQMERQVSFLICFDVFINIINYVLLGLIWCAASKI